MISGPVNNMRVSAASSCPASSLAETSTETIKAGSCSRIWLLRQHYRTIFLLFRYLVCSSESYSADFVIFFFSPLAFSAAQFSAFPKDVSILTIPSTFQTLKHMVFLIMYLPSFLRPHHGGRPLSAPPPPRSLFKASSPVSWWCGEGLTCE